MQERFDIHTAPQSPLRADPRYPQADQQGHIAGVEATSRGLVRSTLKAAAAAAALLVVFHLPAEYGIDPTGLGGVLGLTEMGLIKQQLAAEDAADAAAAAAMSEMADPALLERLGGIEAQLAAISAVIGVAAAPVAPAVAPPVAPVVAPAVAPEPAPATVVPETAAVEAAVAEAVAAEAVAAEPVPAEPVAIWRDEFDYVLAPGQGIEVKLAMEEGQTARFAWTANGSVVNFDLHGDGGGRSISYETGRAVPEMAGELTAAFTGNHGWFWRNRTNAPVTVTLRTGGEYAEVKNP